MCFVQKCRSLNARKATFSLCIWDDRGTVQGESEEEKSAVSPLSSLNNLPVNLCCKHPFVIFTLHFITSIRQYNEG